MQENDNSLDIKSMGICTYKQKSYPHNMSKSFNQIEYKTINWELSLGEQDLSRTVIKTAYHEKLEN